MQISVIIPAYNRATFLERSLNSLLHQTIKPDEILLIDDGSTDETPMICKNYPQVRYIYKENGGVSSARNLGIKNATFEWLAFLDSDDEWLKEKLEKQINFHRKNPKLLFSHTNEEWIRNGKRIKQKAHHRKLRSRDFIRAMGSCLISPSTVMMHRDILKVTGYFDESLRTCEDYDLWLRILRKYEIGFLEESLTIKHGHDMQLSNRYHSMDRERIYALRKHLDSEFHDAVCKEIERRRAIIAQGAIKRGKESIL